MKEPLVTATVVDDAEVEHVLDEHLRGGKLWQFVSEAARIPVKQILTVACVVVYRNEGEGIGEGHVTYISSGVCGPTLASALRSMATEIEEEIVELPACSPAERS